MSDGVTHLRINTDSGEMSFGSGQPGAPQPADLSDAELANITAYTSMDEFIADTQTAAYKGNPLDPRPGEAYRRNAELRLLKMERLTAERAVDFAPANDAEAIVQLDPSIPLAVAEAAVRDGPFLTRESRNDAYASPRYKTSADYRNWVAARDALTGEL